MSKKSVPNPMSDSRMPSADTRLHDGPHSAVFVHYFRSSERAIWPHRIPRQTRGTAFLNSLEYLPVTPEIARQAGLLRRDWQKKGQTLSYTDVTIAAVALSGEVPLLTDNRKHFPMPELQLLPLPDRTG